MALGCNVCYYRDVAGSIPALRTFLALSRGILCFVVQRSSSGIEGETEIIAVFSSEFQKSGPILGRHTADRLSC